MRSALLLFPEPEGRRWLRFEDPAEVLVADRLDEVPGLIEAADAAAHDGRWAVLAVTYDAGPAFDPAIKAAHEPGTPYAVVGIFDEAIPAWGPTLGGYAIGPLDPVMDAAHHGRAVMAIKEHLAAGDTYQVNLTTRLDGAFSGDPQGLFAGLVRAQGAAHAVYIDLGDRIIVSASPELLLARDGRRLWTRPMKGTAARGASLDEDREAIHALRASSKQRAENTMIVDMARNDLGRIADVGSVVVPNLHAVEHYPTVHQMVSLVEATSSVSLRGIFDAIYPAASITGAPKVRTTEIIESLEATPRGFYCGTLGAVAPGGRAELNVAIRTVVIDTRDNTLQYGVGGGIVWDSNAAEEWAEIEAKSRVLDPEAPDYRLLETLVVGPEPDVDELRLHLDRLWVSGTALGFGVDVDAVAAAIAAVRVEEPIRLRVLVDWRGVIEIERGAVPPPVEEAWVLPVDRRRVRSDDVFLQHKTTHRVVYERARARFPEAPDVVLVNEQEEVTETTIGNLVFDFDGRLVTPAVRCGLLAGTRRAAELRAGTIVEDVVPLERVGEARSTWLINAVRGWVPVRIRV